MSDRREQRAEWRQRAQAMLTSAGIAYTDSGGGAHLLVTHRGREVHYWPGTGTWRRTDGKRRGRGYRSLLEYLAERDEG